jgi:hypothetical protein
VFTVEMSLKRQKQTLQLVSDISLLAKMDAAQTVKKQRHSGQGAPKFIRDQRWPGAAL